MEFYDFPYLGHVIIPTDEVIFFRGVGQPPTSKQWSISMRALNNHVDWIPYWKLTVGCGGPTICRSNSSGNHRFSTSSTWVYPRILRFPCREKDFGAHQPWSGVGAFGSSGSSSTSRGIKLNFCQEIAWGEMGDIGWYPANNNVEIGLYLLRLGALCSD